MTVDSRSCLFRFGRGWGSESCLASLEPTLGYSEGTPPDEAGSLVEASCHNSLRLS
jgi:hypothetical protein